MRLPSMVRRLIGWQVAAMLVAWMGLSFFIVFRMLAFGDGDLDRRIDFLAQSLAEAASAARGDPTALTQRLRKAESIFVDGVLAELDASAGYVPVYQVWSATGVLLYASPAAPQQMLGTQSQGLGTAVIAKYEYRTVAATSADSTVRVVVAERTDQRLAQNIPLLRTIAIAQLSILTWSIAVMWFAGRRGFRPLIRLADRISKREPGDLAPLSTIDLYAETAPIVLEINSLLARESRRLETERGFLADAAHELRTPLAAIGAQAHILGSATEPADRQAALKELEQGMHRASHLMRQLLDIARLESGSTLGPKSTVDLADLCRQRLAALTPRARTKSIAIAFDAPEAVPAEVDRGAWISIVDNVVDNAIRYTPHGGHVDIQLQCDAESAALRVRDDGPGIPIEDRERAFDRFVRLSANTDQSGSGLGLAIVRRAVESVSGSIRFVEGRSGSGLGLLVRIPLRGELLD